MKISVALCTYNGEDFIDEQLKSIFAQTIVPNEVIICDDCSNDNTVEVIKNHTFSEFCKIFKNEKQLGTISNFEKAISLCSGDLIFLADQDDLWMTTKVEETINFFEENTQKSVVFTDADLIDFEGKTLLKNLWSEVRFRNLEQTNWINKKEIDVLIQGNRVTGCTVAIKKEFLAGIMPFPKDLVELNFIHDTWIAWTAAAQHKIGFIDKNLVAYRQHPKQQIGAIAKVNSKKVRFWERIFKKNPLKKDVYLKQGFYFSSILKMFERYNLLDKAAISKIRRAKNHFENRGNLPDNPAKKTAIIFKEILEGNYHHYVDADAKWYNPWLAILGDILE